MSGAPLIRRIVISVLVLAGLLATQSDASAVFRSRHRQPESCCSSDLAPKDRFCEIDFDPGQLTPNVPGFLGSHSVSGTTTPQFSGIRDVLWVSAIKIEQVVCSDGTVVKTSHCVGTVRARKKLCFGKSFRRDGSSGWVANFPQLLYGFQSGDQYEFLAQRASWQGSCAAPLAVVTFQ